MCKGAEEHILQSGGGYGGGREGLDGGAAKGEAIQKGDGAPNEAGVGAAGTTIPGTGAPPGAGAPNQDELGAPGTIATGLGAGAKIAPGAGTIPWMPGAGAIAVLGAGATMGVAAMLGEGAASRGSFETGTGAGTGAGVALLGAGSIFKLGIFLLKTFSENLMPVEPSTEKSISTQSP